MLEAELHSDLTFRATVNARKGEGSKKQGKGEPKEGLGTKLIYCSEYNKGTCLFDDHHEGVFNKKTVTEWHVCRKCLMQEGHPRRFHPDFE